MYAVCIICAMCVPGCIHNVTTPVYQWLYVDLFPQLDWNAEVRDPLIPHRNGLFLKAVDHNVGLCV